MAPGTFRKYRMLKRYKDIVDVLIKYEFGHIVDRMGLRPFGSFKSRVGKSVKKEYRYLTGPERARMALEELGPTYVKLGQILSMRHDLIPAKYANEFARLQDNVPPFDFESVKRIIKNDLGKDVSEFFSEFREEPIASASIGQVHYAKLLNGDEVAVKVQRPGIRKVIESDLDIMYSLAGFAEQHIEGAELYKPTDIVDEFSKSIHAEMDYVREATNIERFSNNLKDDPNIYVHKVFWDFCGEYVLTTEYIRGIKGDDFEKIDEYGFNRYKIAENGGQSFMKQVFEDGVFHADAHSGNVLIMWDGKIALLDFGMVGYLPDYIRKGLVDTLIAIVERDTSKYIEILREFGMVGYDVDTSKLTLDIEYILNKYYGRPMYHIDGAAMIEDIVAVLRRNWVTIPNNLAMLIKGMMTIAGFGTMMAPGFNIIQIAEPYAKKLMHERLSPKNLSKTAFKDIWEFGRFFHKLPKQMSNILTSVQDGEARIVFKHEGIEPVVSEINAASNRLSFSLIIASIIIGSSLVIQTGMGPVIGGIPLLGLAGFVIAGIFGMGLVIYIIRSGSF
ncbi:serine/threonine protein kinase [Methanohalobium evestigatum Z-7303]|uniref:Serine/threonine protein kinase n=1 Tax=Methanohalobium evestigatum (strain ATCC BAA-1072 / DSM 3721 / NBRC 107634 / OCM 161 / Z-7303) TaxID=644295 RepID=D7E9U4_METEZ|nr:AarF/ABC1/UbiB kinase family protein [Methanohalobium evestigatum]ADI74366.1 serine/threonine protein kinase [Methanohalobium evestigatum Z-7303]